LPVLLSRALTVAFGNSPSGPETVPDNRPVVVCAAAISAETKSNRMIDKVFRRVTPSGFPQALS
jgi:hypothetical protein